MGLAPGNATRIQCWLLWINEGRIGFSLYHVSAGDLLDLALVFGWCQDGGPGSELLKVCSVLRQWEGYNRLRNKELRAGRLCH